MKRLLFIPFILLLGINLGCEKEASKLEKNRFLIEGKVAFVSSRAESPYSATIYENGKFTIVHEDGGGAPKFSPDGKELLQSRALGLEIVNLENNHRQIIMDPEGKDINQFLWLPAGNALIATAYTKNKHRNSPFDIYVFQRTSNQWRNLTNFKGVHEGIHDFDVFKNGKDILFAYSSDWSKRENMGTYIMDLQTLEMKKIKDWGGKYKIFPDQKRVAVQRGIETEKGLISFSEISVFNLETGEEKFYTRDGAPKSRPTVSPDGKKILYSATTNIGSRIFMIDLETGQKREMFDRKPYYYNKPSRDSDPDWAWA